MAEPSGLMRGKRGLIMGVANNRSIAWGIARACRAQGAELAFTNQGDALRKRVEPLAAEVEGTVAGHCDVAEPATIDQAFGAVAAKWTTLDFVVHAIAFSDKDQLVGRYVDTTAENFARTMLISCYSFTAIAQRAEKLMPQGGSLLTLTYYGAEKWMPHYNVMGIAKAALEDSVRYVAADLGAKNIRVNAISAGPIKTLASAGIGDFRYILKWNEYNTPLRRNIAVEEVGDAGVYFLSDLSRGVTGEIHHVDAGYHVVGMKHPDPPDLTVTKAVPLVSAGAPGAVLVPPRPARLEQAGAAARPPRHGAQRVRTRPGGALRRNPARSVCTRTPPGGRPWLRILAAPAGARDHGRAAHDARALRGRVSARSTARRNLVR